MNKSTSRRHLDGVGIPLIVFLLSSALLGCGVFSGCGLLFGEEKTLEPKRPGGKTRGGRAGSTVVEPRDFGTPPEIDRALNYGDPALEREVERALTQQDARDSLIQELKTDSVSSRTKEADDAWQALFGN